MSKQQNNPLVGAIEAGGTDSAEATDMNTPNPLQKIRIALNRLISAMLLTVLLPWPALATGPNWSLVWEDDFNTGTLDTNKWTEIDRGHNDWNRHMSSNPACYIIRAGKIALRGIVNTNSSDSAKAITGGITTKGKFSFTYGKVEIRAKLGHSKGAWPAFWMKPSQPTNTLHKHKGEIDLMEHLNFDRFIYQTVHTHYTLDLGIKTNPISHATARFNHDDFNIFGLEWYPDRLVFTVNRQPTFTYSRIRTDREGQWPFDRPFYLLLSMQLGGNWVGKIDYTQLPVQMEIDSVKIYQDKSVTGSHTQNH
jgi:beta-glucanase (GH16 family)